MNTTVIPQKDTKDPDYGKSMDTLQLEYLWLKTQADLAARLAQARLRYLTNIR